MLPRHGWANSWTSIVCAYEKNGAGQYKKTKLPNFCENCNTYLCRNCLRDAIPKTNQKGGRLYDIFAMKVAFSGVYFLFRVFY